VEDTYQKKIEVNGAECELEILDTAGTEQFTAMRDLFMRTGQGFILVYSIVSLSSFNEAVELKERILRTKECEKVPMILVGNKCDLESRRVISRKQGEDKAKELDCLFFETSALTTQNVETIFFELIKYCDEIDPPKPPEVKKTKILCYFINWDIFNRVL